MLTWQNVKKKKKNIIYKRPTKPLTKCSSDNAWFVLPVHKEEVSRYPWASDEEAHTHLIGPHIQGQEHQEATHQQEDNRHSKVDLQGGRCVCSSDKCFFLLPLLLLLLLLYCNYDYYCYCTITTTTTLSYSPYHYFSPAVLASPTFSSPSLNTPLPSSSP